MNRICCGDRVKVVGVSGVHDTSFDINLVGLIGHVMHINHLGICDVEFDDGTWAKLWSGIDIVKHKPKKDKVRSSSWAVRRSKV